MTTPLLVATAGHVDHGKSTLVQALTGTDPDRWREEKQRGITIDLGFAHLQSAGHNYAFVDVPGHEKFIHNMLAGVGSIDAVLFVIAADESIMPQTREHARALHFLGVDQICLVITKVDLVSDDLLELLLEEVDEWLASLSWQPVAKAYFSSKRPPTKQAVLDALSQLKPRTSLPNGGFRLAVDRVFASAGAGTVVTGTVDRGRVTRDQAVQLQPTGGSGRVRQLQQHGAVVEAVASHTRAAINLSGIHHGAIHRGECLFQAPAVPEPSRALLVRLTDFVTDWQPGPKHHFHLHHLSQRVPARLRWRHKQVALLHLQQPQPFWALDRGLIRDGSPLTLCAGFEVIDPQPQRLRRKHLLPVVETLPADLDLAAWQRWAIDQRNTPMTRDEMWRLAGFDLQPQVMETVTFLDERYFLATARLEQFSAELLALVGQAHEAQPLYRHLSRSHVRSLAEHFADVLWTYLLEKAQREGQIHIQGNRLCLKQWQPRWQVADRQRCSSLLATVDPTTGIYDRRQGENWADLENLLLWEGYFVAINRDLCILAEKMMALTEHLHRHYKDQSFSIAQLKETFGLTRKTAIPILEWLDKTGLTRRVGDSRVWIATELPELKTSWTPP